MNDRYTFGDGERAAARLRRLAEIYEPVTRELLLRSGRAGCAIAVDLGCGPGWSTRLLRAVLQPVRTVGLDAEARRLHGPEIEFLAHDVTRASFPVRPELLLCRFLLTHLRDTDAVLATWASAAASSARLLVHETESLTSAHPAIARYYELVTQLQRHYGQLFDIGARLEGAALRSPWRVVDSRAVLLELPAARMCELHVANLRTWRDDDYARQAFDRVEQEALAGIVAGTEAAGSVRNVVRQVVAERRA